MVRQIDFLKTQTMILIAAAVCLSATAASVRADWGHVTGRFVLDGDAPTPTKINVTKDVEFCGKHELVDESIIVGDDSGLANVFFYLYLKRGKSVDAHPDYAEAANQEVVLDNLGCRFEPHVLLVKTGQTLVIKNSDIGIGHNTNATLVANQTLSFNDIVPNGAPLRKQFAKSESYPMPFACNIHPWMKAYVLIRDNPYMAVTGSDGKFRIENLPAGEHEFVLWSGRTLRGVKIGGKKTSRRGRVKLKIPAGEALDLGDVSVPLKALK